MMPDGAGLSFDWIVYKSPAWVISNRFQFRSRFDNRTTSEQTNQAHLSLNIYIIE